jgi:hypothetical protein
MMNDKDLAEEIVARLNRLLKDVTIHKDIEKLIETRISVTPETCNHPTIQVYNTQLGFLGLLNGIVGVIPSGRREGSGYIGAQFGEEGNLVGFTVLS